MYAKIYRLIKTTSNKSENNIATPSAHVINHR